MAAVEDDFESWLSLKLKELNTDEGVFGSYIKGILDGDETIDEKTEALEGILTEITETDIPVHCQQILDRWKSCRLLNNVDNDAHSRSLENVEEKLVRLMESNAPSTTVHRNYTEEERRIREAILAQYSQTSDKESDDGEGNDDSGGGGGGVGGGGGIGGEGKENGLFRNTNASAVQQAEKEKREKAKLDSQKKKEKDKEDREKQKKEQQERKEKRKTQKGERRR